MFLADLSPEERRLAARGLAMMLRISLADFVARQAPRGSPAHQGIPLVAYEGGPRVAVGALGPPPAAPWRWFVRHR